MALHPSLSCGCFAWITWALLLGGGGPLGCGGSSSPGETPDAAGDAPVTIDDASSRTDDADDARKDPTPSEAGDAVAGLCPAPGAGATRCCLDDPSWTGAVNGYCGFGSLPYSCGSPCLEGYSFEFYCDSSSEGTGLWSFVATDVCPGAGAGAYSPVQRCSDQTAGCCSAAVAVGGACDVASLPQNVGCKLGCPSATGSLVKCEAGVWTASQTIDCRTPLPDGGLPALDAAAE
jgi:hypothetical protein